MGGTSAQSATCQVSLLGRQPPGIPMAKHADTAVLAPEIDERVYPLWGMAAQEIKPVEEARK